MIDAPIANINPQLQEKALEAIAKRGTLQGCDFVPQEHVSQFYSYLKAKRLIKADPRGVGLFVLWEADNC